MNPLSIYSVGKHWKQKTKKTNKKKEAQIFKIPLQRNNNNKKKTAEIIFVQITACCLDSCCSKLLKGPKQSKRLGQINSRPVPGITLR